jgi:RNA polymerase sigma factor (sigma-70 family)
LCREGSERAWNRLVDRYEGLVWSVAVETGLDTNDASDVFQYVWLELFRSLRRIRDAESLPKWLMVATRRQAYKVSARRRRPLLSIEEDGGPALLDPRCLPDERVVDMEQRRRLETALARMAENEAELLRLLFLDPKRPSYEEISRRTGLAIGSIGPIRARYLKKLRNLMEESS